MFDVFYIGSKPGLFAHERECVCIQQAQDLSRTRFCWIITYLADYTGFDFLWEPPPWQAHQRHAWASQWQRDSGTYLVPRHTYHDTNYHTNVQILRRPDWTRWTIPDLVTPDSFDFSWHPDPTEPDFEYHFGTQWQATGGPIYGGTSGIKIMQWPRCEARASTQHWLLPDIVDADQWDFSWHPDPLDPPYIYEFATEWHDQGGPTYHVPGAVDTKHVLDLRAKLLVSDAGWRDLLEIDRFDRSWRPHPKDPPYIYVFGNQWWPAEIMPTVEYHAAGATERKYLAHPVARLFEDLTHWSIPSGVDTRDMDFSWVPDPGEPPYIYQFATQHQKTGGPQYQVPGATEIKYLDMMRAEVASDLAPVFEIDHMDGNAGLIPNTVKKIRYFDNYRDTLIRLARGLQGQYEHIWVCSSICDYSDFDFSWHPEAWQSTMLHVFASDDQKFGDTFYLHVPTFADRAEVKALLEWTSVNFVPHRSVPRRCLPVVRHQDDSHVDHMRGYAGTSPLVVFANRDPGTVRWPAVNLWRAETKTVIPLDKGASVVVMPKVAVSHIHNQVYDYAHVDRSHRDLLSGEPLDIVFVSNGEPNAEDHWLWLKESCHTRSIPNRLVRVDGVNGRAAAYQAALAASETPWAFCVFAKLEVNAEFDWSWQPDRLQQPKHYIFHAVNPVNGLVYGHQAIIAYNKKLVMINPAEGLDFTLDQPHEVVPEISGTANYAATAWMAWRTAFREALKLRHSLPDVENQYRLDRWLAEGWGINGEWSMRGAQDAVDYYDEVSGDFAELKKSYEWAWLASYAMLKRGLVPGQ